MKNLALLMVKSENISRQLTSMLLAMDFQVKSAGTASSVLKSKEEVAFVFVELDSDGKTGWKALDALCVPNLLKTRVVIGITENLNSDDEETAYKKGCVDVMRLPLNPYVLRRRIEQDCLGYIYRGENQLMANRCESTLQLENSAAFQQELKEALALGQFEVYLQPIYSLSEGRTVSAEALIRWNHPQQGLLLPKRFIPFCESTGFISEIDKFVCTRVCEILNSRKAQGLDAIPISVNISRQSFLDKDILQELSDLVMNSGIQTNLIKFEITESAYSQSTKLLYKMVQQIQEHGIEIMMDDFGSAYSSLNLLKDLPVDILKIDLKFFENFETSKRAGCIVTSIIRMARWLNIPVIAEGIETKSQVNFLKSIGCDKIQGFYFSHPLVLSEFEQFVFSNSSIARQEVALEENQIQVNELLGGNPLIQKLANSVLDGIMVLEKVNGKLEILSVNSEFYKKMGLLPSDLKLVYDNVWFKSLSELFHAVSELSWQRVLPVDLPSGERREVLTKVSVLGDSNGSGVLVVAVSNPPVL